MDDLEFIETGIPGLDALLETGILSGSVTLIVGSPGSGKSILGMQMVQHAAAEGETGLYMSLEEDRDSLLAHMRGFDWPLDELMDDGRLLIEDNDPFTVADAIEGWIAKQDRDDSPLRMGQKPLLLRELEDDDPDRVVIDSLSALESAFSTDDPVRRQYIHSLFRYFREQDIDAFVIVESQSLPDQITETGQAEFLADGVIIMHREQHARGIEVYKMRGTSFHEKIAPMDIREGQGIVIRPDEQFFPGEESGETFS